MKLPTLKTVHQKIDHAKAGRTVRTSRENAGISLRELSRRMNKSAAFLSDLELGRRNWTEELFQLAVKKLKA